MEVDESIAACAHAKQRRQQNYQRRQQIDCDGIMGKSKQVDICAPSCSAVQ